MATLTETAFYSRRIIKWGIVGLIAFTILRIIFSNVLLALQKAFPAPVLRPNYLWGKLPAVSFPPPPASPSAELTFTLQTISGDVPEASEAAKVYFMPKNRINLLSLSQAQEFVGTLDFASTPRQLDSSRYRWLDLTNPLRSIDVDIVSNHFTLTYAFPHDLALFSERNLPNSAQAITEGYNFLQTIKLNQTDLTTTDAKVTFLKLVGDRLEPTTSQSQANAVKVHFFRKSYNGMQVVTDIPKEANVTVTLSSNRRDDKRLLGATYAYWPVDERTVGVYTLKTSAQAWEELVAGKAYYASLPTSGKTAIPITDIYLAYYDSKNPQLYLQPVFVFEGEEGFLAYVPAIESAWVQ